jgi:hypothetical protein
MAASVVRVGVVRAAATVAALLAASEALVSAVAVHAAAAGSVAAALDLEKVEAVLAVAPEAVQKVAAGQEAVLVAASQAVQKEVAEPLGTAKEEGSAVAVVTAWVIQAALAVA